MTQAFNLSQLANNLDSSGRLDATDGLVNALPVANGGTGASTSTAARTNLGLGTMAIQNSSSVSISGGSVTGITDLAVLDGGTGASTAANARTNLSVPSTTGSGASGTWGINVTGNAATVTTITTTQVANATAGVAAGSIGTYMLATYSGAVTVLFGETTAGSNLRPANATGNGQGDPQTGTWRCMGYSFASSTSGNLTTLWLRIS
jgi:hypothetical protein